MSLLAETEIAAVFGSAGARRWFLEAFGRENQGRKSLPERRLRSNASLVPHSELFMRPNILRHSN